MKKIVIFFLVVFFAFCVLLYPNVIKLTKSFTDNFIHNIIPALLPLIFLINILEKCNILSFFLTKNSFLNNLVLIIISILLGAPANLILFNKLEKKDLISNKQKNLLVATFSSFSFSYLCFLFSENINMILLVLASEIFVYSCFYKKERINRKHIKIIIARNCFQTAIEDTLKTLAFIYFTTLSMNFLFVFNLSVYDSFSPIIMMFEFSFSGTFVKNLMLDNKNLIFLIIASLNSLSVYFQLFYFSQKYDLLSHIKKRTYIGILTVFLYFVFVF